MPNTLASRTTLVVITLLVTWLVWGSSFVAITYTLDSMPPLLMMSTRFVTAGIVATVVGLVLARRAGAALPSARAWRDSSIIGFGFIAVGMGVCGWSATRLPTGIAALLVATAPLWIVLIELVRSRGASRNALALGGVAIGIGGLGALMAPGGSGAGIDVVACLVVVASTGVWAAASLFAQQAEKAGGLLLGTGMQMLTGGAQLGLVALVLGEASRVDLGSITASAIGGWAYLVLAASIGGFLAYGWLLDNVSAGTASTHAFVNPLVAVALGVAVLGEQLDARMFVAGAAVIVAVVLLLVAEMRAAAAAGAGAELLGGSELGPVLVPGVDVAPEPTPVSVRRTRIARPVAISRPGGSRRGWAPAPTPAFASRRAARPAHATDGMDALAIDEALDGLG